MALVIFCGCSLTKTVENKSFFRAKFNDDTIENRIQDFEYWNEIQSQEVDAAFEAYQKGAYIQRRFPDEAALIFRFIDRGSLLGVAVEAHEKWEVLEYIRKGYSMEEIGDGRAYEEYKPIAHTEARFKELMLYQFWYEQLFNERPPTMKAFLFVHPLLKIIAEDIYKVEVDTQLMKMLINELEKYESVMKSEKCSKEDIEKCIRLFDRTGYDYGDQKDLFLKRGLDFLNEFH